LFELKPKALLSSPGSPSDDEEPATAAASTEDELGADDDDLPLGRCLDCRSKSWKVICTRSLPLPLNSNRHEDSGGYGYG
jgi:hypothetical protein